MTPWPKLFQNLRSTRETELAETFPLHVVCSWIGNTQSVVAKHYLQVTDEHFKKALQNPVQYDAAKRCNAPQEKIDKVNNTLYLQGNAKPCEMAQTSIMGDTGLEPVTLRV